MAKVKIVKKKRTAGRPVSNITVPAATRRFWKRYYQVGDFTEISEKKGIDRPTIRKAWRGNASLSNIEKITDFFVERNKEMVILEEKIKLSTMASAKLSENKQQ